MHILILTAFDGSRLSEIGLTTWFTEMRQATEKSERSNELPASTWERLDISRTKEEEVWKIMPIIERADAIIFLTYTRPPINLLTFLRWVGAHATKPYRLPGCMLGFVFVDKEKKNPEDQYYWTSLRAFARRMQMDLSPGMVRIKKSLTLEHEQFARNLVFLLLKKEMSETMLEPA